MRISKISRKTKEVLIELELNIDGKGNSVIETDIEPLNHLLTLFSFHGLFDLNIIAKGDLPHHLIEDIGIVLGKAFKEALGDKVGIRRYGCFTLVMDKTVVETAVDISGRPSLHFDILSSDRKNIYENFIVKGKFDNTDFGYKEAEELLRSFVQHAGISTAILVKSYPDDLHHLLEACFKSLGKSLDEATQIDCRRDGVPSTKGIID